MNTAAQTKDTDEHADKMRIRFEALYAEDEQFRYAMPDQRVVDAKIKPGLRLAEVVQTVMEGYADRPALGQRVRELVEDPATGRKTQRLLPTFETLTYAELWSRARAIASANHHHGDSPLRAGDFVCLLGFTSPEYANLILANIHLGAVNVPLQTSAPTSDHAAIIEETEPRIFATGVEYIDAAVDAVLAGDTRPDRLVVFDYTPEDDNQRELFDAACRRLAGSGVGVETFGRLVERGRSLPEPPLYMAGEGEDPLAWLFYTSGSTGTPKGAVFTEKLVITTWLSRIPMPAITLSFMPMAHLIGNGYLFMALANGGTSYCSPKSDLSTLFEDFALVRPTMASLVPRVCELFYHRYLGELDRRIAKGEDPDAAAEALKRETREKTMGGRLLNVGCGSASLAPETYTFMESMLDMHISIGYSSTEIAGGTVLIDWKVQRPPVIDYRLEDVPELGYFSTDKPYPRGELLVKSDRFIGGYYKQPELTSEKFGNDGFYRTGDVMAELAPDHLVFVDRTNNVQKLSQGEFVAISKLEALYSHIPSVRQIYVYGTSERSYLLAVIVPSEELVARFHTGGDIKGIIRNALQTIAEEHQLNSYEIPRDFLIETEPFSLGNGLLTEVGKHRRPALKERYAEELEQMYAKHAQDQIEDLRVLRTAGADRPTLETVSRALQATLGVSAADVQPESKFAELGGDSLSALSFSLLLEEIFGLEVPVGIIGSPTMNVRYLADYIESGHKADAKRVSFAKVHGKGSTTVRAEDIKLDKFIDRGILDKATTLEKPGSAINAVLLTGVTGYLGRFQMMVWLQRLAETGGKLICLARGSDAEQARQRIESALDTDQALMEKFRSLAADHLEVLPGDLNLPSLGLEDATWQRLTESVDLIVHTGAHVNHMFPYSQLFDANVAGTAELIRLALTRKLKRFHYVSTLGVTEHADRLLDEDSDIRNAIPGCEISDHYANGYGISKWASEVLMREVFDLCELPVSVFRPGMILAHSEYTGQINVPDMFSRLLYSLIETGIAPATFYAQDLSNGRPPARYEGLSVDFLADAITAIGERDTEGFHTYNLASPHTSEISLDTIVDWLIETGCKIERIEPYNEWLARFETAMRALPEAAREASLLAILKPYQEPQYAVTESMLPAEQFGAASKAAGLEIPAMSEKLIKKYVADLRYHQLI